MPPAARPSSAAARAVTPLGASADGLLSPLVAPYYTRESLRPVAGPAFVPLSRPSDLPLEPAAVPARLARYTPAAAFTFSVRVALPATTGANATDASQCGPGAMTPFQLPLARQ